MCNCGNISVSAWNQTVTQDSLSCDISVAMLNEWKKIFEYVQGKGLTEHVGFSKKEFFGMYGSILTALSYSGDYCSLESRLTKVRNSIEGIKVKSAYGGNH